MAMITTMNTGDVGMREADEIDPFLRRKWQHAFANFFDLNKNGVVEWEDLCLLKTVIAKSRGEDSREFRKAETHLSRIWDKLVEATRVDRAENVKYHF
ncbi:hypothetical protein AB6A40_009794 [Gnathostoma spinigerum]|uniref:EF-hand domain-containing protein n=1 Tax=Gnathostoma spinigerum TaxID=75299 RepID=A0ABD6F262_9BILA